MKKLLILLVAVAACTSCDLFKMPIKMDEVVDNKIQIDGADNPAKRFVLKKDLANKRIKLFDVTVKDVVESSNVEYDFCVKVDVQTKKGPVECYIYSTDVKTVSRLVKGKTKIDVAGVFGRFFSLLDDYYTKVDIIRACIKIK